MSKTLVEKLRDRNAIAGNGLFHCTPLMLQAADELERLRAGIVAAIQDCGNCGGQGFEYVDDGTGEDVVGEACQNCCDLRELIQDYTDHQTTAAKDSNER